MKIDLHPQLNKNPANTLPGVRLVGSIFVFLLASSFPAKAILQKQTTNPRTFADWCLNKNNLSVGTFDTVNAMLLVAQTQDCHQADKLLSSRTKLSINDRGTADLRPLSTLTNLTELVLSNNGITDLKPLSSLTNLTYLYLGNNQIADLKPLSSLTNLSRLYLGNNQSNS
jgi:internalin A